MAATACTLERSTLPPGASVSASYELTPGRLSLTVSASWGAAVPEFAGRKDFLLSIDRQLVMRGLAWDQLPGVLRRADTQAGDEGGEVSVVKVGLPGPVISQTAMGLTGGWPKRVGSLLFAEGPDLTPLWLDSPAKLFAWLQGRLPASARNPLSWARGEDMVTQEQFHAYLGQTADAFDAVEPMPHWPPMPGHYYMHRPAEGGDGKALRWLVNRFCPATDADWHLIEAFFLSLFWGGPAGTRPAWLFTATEDDDRGGRGVGKSTVAKMAALLLGGSLTVDKDEKMADVKRRLLSAQGLRARLVLLDNLKTLKFSWGQLEGEITMTVLSGHQMYHGEGQRPNTLTWALTLNGVSLSKDMAQRCVIVRLARPEYSAAWEEETAAYIDAHRWAIVGDCLARLRAPAAPLAGHGRWGAWEDGVLARLADPANCQRVILDRQTEVDEDSAEADIVLDHFRSRLARSIDPERACVFFPSKAAAEWLAEATGERRPVNKACAHLRQLNISEIKKSDRGGGRGFVWRGAKAPAGLPATPIDSVEREDLGPFPRRAQ